jgi:hypothetical protein
MTTEIWKDVIGYEGLYQVSSLGRVKSLPRNGTIKQERILKHKNNGLGYLQVILSNKNKIDKYVHILVAESFLGYKVNKGKICVDHLNSIKCDNRLDNLRIITYKENISRSKTSNTGHTGVYLVNNKYRVIFMKKHLGYYNSMSEAKSIYLNELKKYENE